jgi:hypothetical protein
MTFALISASRFEFSYDKNEQLPLRTLNDDLKRNISSTTTKHSYPNENDAQQTNIHSTRQDQYETSNTIKLMQIIQIFITLKNGTFLFIAW